MKSISVLAVFAATMSAVVGCNSNNADNGGIINLPAQDQKSPGAQAKFELPKIKYPAAIIYEGGKGDPWFDSNGSKHTPSWRLYLCLERTSVAVDRQVDINFNQLNQPIELSVDLSDSHAHLYTERLNSLTLKYRYSTELSDDPDKNYGYAYGSAYFNAQSQQNWELVDHAPGYNPGPHESFLDVSVFNTSTMSGSLTSFGQYTYESKGTKYYVSSALDRFTFSEKDRRSNVITVCEKEDKPYVLQIGNEITPINQ